MQHEICYIQKRVRFQAHRCNCSYLFCMHVSKDPFRSDAEAVEQEVHPPQSGSGDGAGGEGGHLPQDQLPR